MEQRSFLNALIIYTTYPSGSQESWHCYEAGYGLAMSLIYAGVNNEITAFHSPNLGEFNVSFHETLKGLMVK